jgi:protein-S-isoprenylcysteine O-methyltransferase Ste14
VFTRALPAFLTLPGVVAFAVPIEWLAAGSNTMLVQPLGLIPLVCGTVALLWCVRDFYVSGKGTLAPWSPPTELVVVGLYRDTRNPMYVAVTVIIVGWAVGFNVVGLYVYAVVVADAFRLRVVFGEEPWLAKTHGARWEEYSRRVPRWFAFLRRCVAVYRHETTNGGCRVPPASLLRRDFLDQRRIVVLGRVHAR